MSAQLGKEMLAECPLDDKPDSEWETYDSEAEDEDEDDADTTSDEPANEPAEAKAAPAPKKESEDKINLADVPFQGKNMKKSLTEKIVYQPNSRVKVAVTNKPEFDEDAGITRYERSVSITVKVGYSDEKLTFSDDEDIAKWIETVDFDDPQLSILDDGPENEE